MPKNWLINAQVNTRYIMSLSDTGTWKAPIGGGHNWKDNVRMAAVSDDPVDPITVGDGDSFKLEVGKDDTIRWVTSEVNPIYLNHRSVCMYGFSKGYNWDDNLTPPSTIIKEAGFVAMLNGFDAPEEPSGTYLKLTESDISIPQTTVRARATSSKITYHMKFLLVDTSKPRKPKVLKYVKVDPTIEIVK